MENIQEKALNTYLVNLEYLKETDQDLHNRVVSLSDVIENNQYKERYHLEYIKEDQEFDIFDDLEQGYIYGRKPKDFIAKQ